MVQEEIVQFIRPYEVFCLLVDVAVLVSRGQFRADGGGQDVEQGAAGVIVRAVPCHPFHQIFHLAGTNTVLSGYQAAAIGCFFINNVKVLFC